MLTVVLVAIQDSSVHEVFVSDIHLIPPGTPTAASLAFDYALHCAPSALLALLVLVYSFVGVRSAPPHSSASEDAALELRIEPLGADAAD
jgi:hypothetical protein